MPVFPVLLQDWHPQNQEAGLQRWHIDMSWPFWKVQHHTSTEEKDAGRHVSYKLILLPFSLPFLRYVCSDYERDRLNMAKPGKEKRGRGTWKTESLKNLHEAMACHRLINDSSVLASPQLHCSQALHRAFTLLPLTNKNFSLKRATLECWKL